MTFEPVLDRLVVKVIQPSEQKTAQGVYIPVDNTLNTNNIEKCIVVAVNKNGYKDNDKNDIILNVDDTIVIDKHSGTQFLDGDTVYKIIRVPEILMKYNEE